MCTTLSHFAGFLLAFCLAWPSSCSTWAFNRTITVSSSTGDDSKCNVSYSVTPCRTLDRAFDLAAANSTLIKIERGNYSLNGIYNFSWIKDFEVKGPDQNSQSVNVSCSGNASLSFVLSENLVFQGLTFYHCGNLRKSNVDKPHKNVLFVTAFYFNYCKNVQATAVDFVSSPGVAVTLYAVGSVNFTECVFRDNQPRGHNMIPINRSRDSQINFDAEHAAVAGGGVYLQLGPKDLNSIHVSEARHSEYVNNQSYIFSHCNFTGNKAPIPELNATLDTPAMPFSRGGGLAIYVGGNGSHNSFVIEHSTFSENRAQWGGGLQLEVQHRGQNNSLFVSSCNFFSNKASFSGGGARMGYEIWAHDFLAPNNFQILNCTFEGNSAMWGGGISIYGTTRPVKLSDQGIGPVHIHRKMTLTTCRWIKNIANVGSAIGAFLYNSNVDDVGPRAPYHVELNQCSVCGNKVKLLNRSVLLGQGAIYTVEVPLIFKTKTIICNNSKTALVLDSATTEIHDEVIFRYNRGYRGGAVAMYGKSKLYFLAKSKLTFEGNHAHEKGGAMYISFPGSPLVNFNATGLTGYYCFFKYEDWKVDYDNWNTSIVFKGNSVDGLGRSIYATTLKNCRRTGETRDNSSALEWKTILFEDKYGNKTTVKEEVRTDPIDIHVASKDWNRPASEVFNATMTLLDEKNNHVFGMVNVDVKNLNSHTHVSLITGSVYLAQNDRVSSLQLEGNEGDEFNISVRTLGSQIVRKHVDNLKISRCPDGFLPRNGECVCAKNESGIAWCDVQSGTIHIKEGFWAGRVDNGIFTTHHCPPSYCSCNKSSSSKSGCLYTRGRMCKGNRNGSSILCGACKVGYSVLIGSEECEVCSNLSLFYFLLYAVVLFVLVMLIMLINLDVFTGYLNAWLYSYQVVSLLVTGSFEFDPFINFVIRLANVQIQLGGGTCLIDGMDDADKLAIMYILPTYILLVVFVLSKAVRAYPSWCFSKRVKAPFGAVCTIFVFCYTNITSISLKILNPAKVGNKLVLYQNGAVEFFKGKHIAYAIIALLYILVFVIPFPLTLMFRPFFTKKCQCLCNLNNLKPVYDSFQGVFKDEYRWCAAFYFVCRILLLLIYTYVQSGEVKRTLLEIACMLVLVVYVHLKPYKDEYNWINILDTVLLSNLSVIAILSTGIGATISKSTEKAFVVMVKILLYVPLGYVFVLLVIMARRYMVLKGGEDGSTTSLYETPASLDDDEP